jgi:di/tripeptidase
MKGGRSTVHATPADVPAQVTDEKAQGTVIDVLLAAPQGALRMSDAVPRLVETSTNLGIVKVGDGALEVSHFSHSSVDTELGSVGQMIARACPLIVEIPPAGFEPAPPAPEAGALSTELWGQALGRL